MAKKQITTTNTTLLRLKGTPFKTAAELKSSEDTILREEWQSVERARVRRELLMKEDNKIILAPLLNGFKARFIGSANKNENLIRVYLTEQDSVQVDIDHQLQSNDINGSLESLVKSMVDGLMSGYLTALGLSKEKTFKENTFKENNSGKA